jgi:hypothetical protein
MRHISHPYTSHCSAGYNRPLATGTVAGKPLGLDLTAARSLRSLPFCAAASLAAALCFIFSSFSACIYLTAGSAAPHVAMAGAFRAALGLRFSCAASPSRSRCGCAALALPSCGSCGSLQQKRKCALVRYHIDQVLGPLAAYTSCTNDSRELFCCHL